MTIIYGDDSFDNFFLRKKSQLFISFLADNVIYFILHAHVMHNTQYNIFYHIFKIKIYMYKNVFKSNKNIFFLFLKINLRYTFKICSVNVK